MALTNAEKQAKWRDRHRSKPKREPSLRVRRKSPDYKPVPSVERMRKSREKHQEEHRLKHIALKVDVLAYYGRGHQLGCVLCGEDRLECLSIDHIKGGGNQQRKKGLRSSAGFYAWLRNNNFPDGYQTLCMNCQFVKRFARGEHN